MNKLIILAQSGADSQANKWLNENPLFCGLLTLLIGAALAGFGLFELLKGVSLDQYGNEIKGGLGKFTSILRVAAGAAACGFGIYKASTLFAIVLGCGDSSVSPTSVQWIDPNTIQQGPTLHEALPDVLLTRIKNVQAIFADVDGTPLDKWIDDFKRDLHPEDNVKIWEDMAIAYESFCGNRGLALEPRKEAFKVILMRSLMSDADVLSRLNLKHISIDDAKAIIAAYPSVAKPITVIRQ